MNLKQLLTELITELNKANSASNENGPWREDDSLPIFSTAESDKLVFFTKESLALIRKISKIFFDGDKNIASVTELENFQKIARQVVANLYAENLLLAGSDDICNESIRTIREKANAVVDELKKEFVHYFPAWTVSISESRPFSFGPVTIMSKNQWVDSVKLPEWFLGKFLNKPSENKIWKDCLKVAINTNPLPEKAEGELADNFYQAIKTAPSIVKIKVVGYEKDLSKKVGQLVCKTALDAISLILGRSDLFSGQSLQIERTLPISIHTIIENDGYLGLPGQSLTNILRHISHTDVINVLTQANELVKALEKITVSLLDSSNTNCPGLCKRWTTALDWYAEGCREQNSAIALAKLGTSLDVLSCGGKYVGILSMVTHLIKQDKDFIIVKGDLNWSVSRLIKEIYDNGRSQILHGTHYDRLKSFEQLKVLAIQFIRIILINCALRLAKYTEPDEDKAFRTIPE